MSPAEIVQISKDINTAVPNLVPTMSLKQYSWGNRDEFLSVDIDAVVKDQHELAHRNDHMDVFSVGIDSINIAPLMLGRTDAWLANNPNHPARTVIAPINVRLLTYVGTTLPGANV